MKFKRLIPALAMLLVSAILLGTSTFAWFSMNTTVTATGLQITAKSSNTFLLIGGSTETTADAIQAQTGADLTTEALAVTDEESAVFPAKPKEASEIGSGLRFETGTPVTNSTSAAQAANWYTAQNNNPANANDSVKNINSLNTTTNDPYEFSKYVIKRTVYLTVADGSDPAHNLTVTATKFAAKTGQTATDITGVKVLVATGANYIILDSATSGAQSLHTTDFTITDQDAIQVDIYVYYDGEEDAVYTNNIADLAAAEIDLQFDVEVGTAA